MKKGKNRIHTDKEYPYQKKKARLLLKGYCGYIYELSNHLNTSFNSSGVPVRVFFKGGYFSLQKIFFKNFVLFWQAKSRLYYPAKREVPHFRQRVNTMTPNRRNLKNNVRFRSSVNQCCTTKRATPMKKFVGAEFEVTFPTFLAVRGTATLYRR